MDSLQGGGLLSKSASAYEHLKRLATRGRLRPDRRLSPTDLAGELRISVTPVRDALVRLAAEGFIRGEDGRGYFTRPYTVREQQDLLGLRMTYLLVGLDNVREQGRPLGPVDLAGIEEEADASSSPQAAAVFVEAVDRLMAGLADGSGNHELPIVVRNVADRTH